MPKHFKPKIYKSFYIKKYPLADFDSCTGVLTISEKNLINMTLTIKQNPMHLD